MAEIVDIQLHPTVGNLSDVVRQIHSRLSNINAVVKITVDDSGVKSLSGLDGKIRQIRSEIDLMEKAAGSAGISMRQFGEQSALAIKRFSAFTVVTSGVIGLAGAIVQATRNAIAFNKEMVRISQVTGQPLSTLGGLREEIERLSTGLGVSSSKLLNAAQVLAQAGLSADDVRVSLEALAKSELSPTFDDITQTVEGAVAIFAQFGVAAEELEAKLGAINAVSAKFAVESADLITAVRRTGGAFKASGGSLEELIALFTSVRATTRESAETIATGFRTIFTRLQRSSTQNALSTLGVQLRDLEGQFVGPYEAVRRISEALSDLRSTDPRFAQVVEELGGFRQVSKVIPLLQQFAVAQRALTVAQEGQTSLSEDAITAQEALAVQITKTKEQFAELVRTVAESDTFKASVDIILKLTQALLRLSESLVPILPALAAFGAFKLSANLKSFASGFSQAIKPGGVAKFATGGLVPGVGNKDSVPAYLTPGEFVVKKSAVNQIGVDTLSQFNRGGYVPVKKMATAGRVRLPVSKNKTGGFDVIGTKGFDTKAGDDTLVIDAAAVFLEEANISKESNLRFNVENAFTGKAKKGRQASSLKNKKTVSVNLYSGGLNPAIAEEIKSNTEDRVREAILSSGEAVKRGFGLDKVSVSTPTSLKPFNLQSITGNIFEAALASVGVPFDEKRTSTDNFDFPKGLGPLAANFALPDTAANISTDAKSKFDPASLGSLAKKARNLIVAEASRESAQKDAAKVEEIVRSKVASIDKNSTYETLAKKFPKSKTGSDVVTFSQPVVADILNIKVTGAGKKETLTTAWQDIGGIVDYDEGANRNIYRFSRKELEERLPGVAVPQTTKTKLKSKPEGKAAGGEIFAQKKGEQVPVMLMPGEYVFDKQTAREIGPTKLAQLNRGIVPGTGNTDSVPAALEAGQYVLNKKATQKLAHGGYVGVQHFAVGGTAQSGQAFGTQGILALSLLGSFASSFGKADEGLSGFINTVSASVAQMAILSATMKELVSTVQQVRAERAESIATARTQVTSDESSVSNLKDRQTRIERIIQSTEQSSKSVTKERDVEAEKLKELSKPQPFQSPGHADEIKKSEARLEKLNTRIATLGSRSSELSKELVKVEQNAKVAAVSLKTSQESLKTLETTTGSKLKETFRQNGTLVGSILVGTIGDVLQSNATKAAAAGSSTTSIGGSTTIQAGFGGAASLGASGAAVGSVFGAPGIAIGAVLGGVVGFVKSFKEATDNLNFSIAQKGLTEFSKTLERINKGTLSSVEQSGRVSRQLQEGLTAVFATTDDDKRKALRSQLEQQAPAVEQFLASLAKTTPTIQAFQAAAGSTIQNLALLTNQSIPDVIKAYEKQIQAQDLQAKITEATNARFEELNERARALSDTMSAVTSARLSTETSQTSVRQPILEAFAGGRASSARQIDTSAIIGSKTAVFDTELFNKSVDRFSRNIKSQAGDRINLELKQINEVKKLVPGLLNVLGAQPFFEAGQLEQRAQEFIQPSVDERKIDKEISNQLIQTLKAELKDDPSQFLTKLTTQRQNIEQELLKGLQATADGIAATQKEISDEYNKYAAAIENARQLEVQVRERLIKAIDVREQAAATRAEFSGTSLSTSAREVFDTQRLEEILRNTGIESSVTVKELSTKLEAFQQNLLKIEDTISRTPERDLADGQKPLLDARDAEKKKIEAVIKALDFFSDATARNAKFQDELSKQRETRQGLRSFTETAVFGTPSAKLDLSRNLIGAIRLAQTKDVRTIPQELVPGVFDVLRQLGDSKLPGLGGLSGKEVIEATIRNESVALLGKTVGNKFADDMVKGLDRERQLQDAILANLTNAAESINKLAGNQESNLTKLVTSLDTNFVTFFKKMDAILTETGRTKLVQEQKELTVKETGLSGQAKAVVELNKFLKTVGVKELDTTNGFVANKEQGEIAAQRVGGLRSGIDILKKIDDLSNQTSTLGQVDSLLNTIAFEIPNTVRQIEFNKRDISATPIEKLSPEERLSILPPEQRTATLERDAIKNSGLFDSIDLSQKLNNPVDIITQILSTKGGKALGTTTEAQDLISKAIKDSEGGNVTDVIRNLLPIISEKLKTTQLNKEVEQKTLEQQAISIFGPGTDIQGLIKRITELEARLKATSDSEGKFIVPLATEMDSLTKAIQENTAALGKLPKEPASPPLKEPLLSTESFIQSIIGTGFAKGGRVPGKGSKDTVPAMLTPGELVIPKGIAKSNDSERLMKFVGRYGFNEGGPVRKRRIEEEIQAVKAKLDADAALEADVVFANQEAAAEAIADKSPENKTVVDASPRRTRQEILDSILSKTEERAREIVNTREAVKLNSVATERGISRVDVLDRVPFTGGRAEIANEQATEIQERVSKVARPVISGGTNVGLSQPLVPSLSKKDTTQAPGRLSFSLPDDKREAILRKEEETNRSTRTVSTNARQVNTNTQNTTGYSRIDKKKVEQEEQRLLNEVMLKSVGQQLDLQSRIRTGLQEDYDKNNVSRNALDETFNTEFSKTFGVQTQRDEVTSFIRKAGLDKTPEQLATEFRAKAPEQAKENVTRRQNLSDFPLAAGRNVDLGKLNVATGPLTTRVSAIANEQAGAVQQRLAGSQTPKIRGTSPVGVLQARQAPIVPVPATPRTAGKQPVKQFDKDGVSPPAPPLPETTSSVFSRRPNVTEVARGIVAPQKKVVPAKEETTSTTVEKLIPQADGKEAPKPVGRVLFSNPALDFAANTKTITDSEITKAKSKVLTEIERRREKVPTLGGSESTSRPVDRQDKLPAFAFDNRVEALTDKILAGKKITGGVAELPQVREAARAKAIRLLVANASAASRVPGIRIPESTLARREQDAPLAGSVTGFNRESGRVVERTGTEEAKPNFGAGFTSERNKKKFDEAVAAKKQAVDRAKTETTEKRTELQAKTTQVASPLVQNQEPSLLEKVKERVKGIFATKKTDEAKTAPTVQQPATTQLQQTVQPKTVAEAVQQARQGRIDAVQQARKGRVEAVAQQRLALQNVAISRGRLPDSQRYSGEEFDAGRQARDTVLQRAGVIKSQEEQDRITQNKIRARNRTEQLSVFYQDVEKSKSAGLPAPIVPVRQSTGPKPTAPVAIEPVTQKDKYLSRVGLRRTPEEQKRIEKNQTDVFETSTKSRQALVDNIKTQEQNRINTGIDAVKNVPNQVARFVQSVTGAFSPAIDSYLEERRTAKNRKELVPVPVQDFQEYNDDDIPFLSNKKVEQKSLNRELGKYHKSLRERDGDTAKYTALPFKTDRRDRANIQFPLGSSIKPVSLETEIEKTNTQNRFNTEKESLLEYESGRVERRELAKAIQEENRIRLAPEHQQKRAQANLINRGYIQHGFPAEDRAFNTGVLIDEPLDLGSIIRHKKLGLRPTEEPVADKSTNTSFAPNKPRQDVKTVQFGKQQGDPLGTEAAKRAGKIDYNLDYFIPKNSLIRRVLGFAQGGIVPTVETRQPLSTKSREITSRETVFSKHNKINDTLREKFANGGTVSTDVFSSITDKYLEEKRATDNKRESVANESRKSYTNELSKSYVAKTGQSVYQAFKDSELINREKITDRATPETPEQMNEALQRVKRKKFAVGGAAVNSDVVSSANASPLNVLHNQQLIREKESLSANTVATRDKQSITAEEKTLANSNNLKDSVSKETNTLATLYKSNNIQKFVVGGKQSTISTKENTRNNSSDSLRTNTFTVGGKVTSHYNKTHTNDSVQKLITGGELYKEKDRLVANNKQSTITTRSEAKEKTLSESDLLREITRHSQKQTSAFVEGGVTNTSRDSIQKFTVGGVANSKQSTVATRETTNNKSDSLREYSSSRNVPTSVSNSNAKTLHSHALYQNDNTRKLITGGELSNQVVSVNNRPVTTAVEQDLSQEIARYSNATTVAGGATVPALVAGGEMIFQPNALPMDVLHKANNGQRLLTGGELSKGQMVYSSSSGDSVPVDLPVGSFVLRASQVERSLNDSVRSRFARGGEVGKRRYQTGGSISSSISSRETVDVRGFTRAVDNFSDATSDMTTGFKTFTRDFNTALDKFSSLTNSLKDINIPSEITLTATHTVNVVHNGAEIFAALAPEMAKVATAKAIEQIRLWADKNFDGGTKPPGR